jgi:hypothetical protein
MSHTLSNNPQMTKKKIALELKARFKGKKLLFAEDLSSLIGSDHRVVKCLRAGLSIPLPTIKDGRRWGIEINVVADWMASRDTAMSSKDSTLLANKRLQAPARQRESLGRSLLALKTQLNSLEAQLEYMRELYEQTLILEQIAIEKLAEKSLPIRIQAQKIEKIPRPVLIKKAEYLAKK